MCVCLLLHETCYWAKRRNCVPVDLSSSTVSHSLPMLCVPKNKCTSCPKKNEQNKKEEKLLPAPSCMCGWCLASVFCPFIGFFSCSSFRVIETINNRNKGERLVKQLNLCCNTYGELWTCTFSNDEVKKYIYHVWSTSHDALNWTLLHCSHSRQTLEVGRGDDKINQNSTVQDTWLNGGTHSQWGTHTHEIDIDTVTLLFWFE